MNITEEFLRLVLPSEGYLCAVIKHNDKFYHRFTKDHEELAAILLKADADNYTVYHACASYVEPKGRRKENVHRIRSLWLDVDLERKTPEGVERVYADEEAATRAVFTFAAQEKLPRPLIVYSGGGLQVYWPFREEIDGEQWQAYARGLRERLRQRLVDFDAARTCDQASILRPIGTHNYKREGKRVRGNISGIGAAPLSSFDAFKENKVLPFSGGSEKTISLGPPPEHCRDIETARGCEIANAYEPSDPNLVAERCQQLRLMRDKKGRLPEPLWFANLATLAFCEGGDQLAHEWSRGDDRYLYKDAQDRLDRSRSVGPATCERFESISPEGCRDCPYRGKVSAPVQLGREPAAVAPENLNGTHTEVHKADVPAFDSDKIQLPEGFIWGEEGGLHELGKTDWRAGKPTVGPSVQITAVPFFLARVERGVGGFSYTFAVKKPHASWETFNIGAETLAGMSGVGKLRGNGVVIMNGEACQNYVRKAQTMLENEKQAGTTVEANGWLIARPGTFVVGERLYHDGIVEPASISQEMLNRAPALRPKGTYAAWQSAANLMLGQGTPPQAFAVIAAFAAPLMFFESANEGGAVINLYSANSGTGKTCAAQCAAAVWGDWKFLNISNDDSHNSRMIVLGLLNNLPLIYDEIVSKDPEKIREFITTYDKGKERLRATTGGHLQRDALTWSNMVIGTSNISLLDTVQHISPSKALSFRILEFECSENAKVVGDLDHVKKIFRDNYGWAGHAFLSYITRPDVFPKVMEVLNTSRNHIHQKYGLNQQCRIYERTLTCCLTAAKILKHMKILHSIDTEATVDWAAGTISTQEFIEDRPDDASLTLGRYLSGCFQDLLIMPHAPTTRDDRVMPRQLPHRGIVGRVDQREGMLYLSEISLKRWAVESNVTVREMLGKLKKQGVFKGVKVMNLTQGSDLPAVKVSTFAFSLPSLELLHPQSTGPSPASPPRSLPGASA